MTKVKIFKGYYSNDILNKNPKALFIFGDNNIGSGKGGQAIIRDSYNSIGIPTKKYPGMASDNFYTDDEYDDNCSRIKKAIKNIISLAPSYDIVYLPEDGLGTGLSALPNKAPLTFKYLNRKIREMILEINGDDELNWDY